MRSRTFDITISNDRDNMRLNIRKINNYSYYSILKITLILMVKEYINKLNNEDNEEILRREFNPNKRISSFRNFKRYECIRNKR